MDTFRELSRYGNGIDIDCSAAQSLPAEPIRVATSIPSASSICFINNSIRIDFYNNIIITTNGSCLSQHVVFLELLELSRSVVQVRILVLVNQRSVSFCRRSLLCVLLITFT